MSGLDFLLYPHLHVYQHPWHIPFMCNRWLKLHVSQWELLPSAPPPLAQAPPLSSSPQLMTTSPFQLLRPETSELPLTFPFPSPSVFQIAGFRCTQNLTISYHLILPFRLGPLAFLAWVYWKRLWTISLFHSLPHCNLFWTQLPDPSIKNKAMYISYDSSVQKLR